MKKPICFAAAGWLAVMAVAAGASTIEDVEHRAEVTLPFTEVKALLEAAKPPPQAHPPVAAAITAAKIALALADPHPSAVATFEVDVFADGWQLVPLASTPFILKEVTAPGATVLIQDDMLCLLARQPGHLTVTLNFEIPASFTQAGANPISLRLTPATVGEVTIASTPAHRLALLESGGQQSTEGTLPTPLAGGEVTVRLVDDQPVVPTKWTSEEQMLVRQQDDRLDVTARIRLAGDGGSGLSARLDLPPSAMQVAIAGADLQSADLDSGASGAGHAALVWTTAGVLERDLVITYKLPPQAAGEPWNIVLPKLSESPPQAAKVMLVPLPGIALSSKDGHAVEASTVWPAWMSDAAAAGGAWESDSTGPVAAESRALPRLEVDTARIPSADFQTGLVSDGAVLCEARIDFKYRGLLHWRFSLPKGSDLLSCEVDGRPVNPLLADDGRLELIMSSEPESAGRSEVRLSYTAHQDAFSPVEGKLALSLPSTPLFIEDLTWGITLPGSYEATAFEGNVEPSGGGGPAANFRKRLVRNEAPSIEIYYRKRDNNH